MDDWGFVRVTAASHPTRVGDPQANAEAMLALLQQHASSSLVLFGELSLSGYTCGELFGQQVLLDACLTSLKEIAQATQASQQIVVVGLPVSLEDRLYNVAAVVQGGRVVACVPKQYLPNHQEYYESRWFAPADGSEPSEVDLGELGLVPFGIDLMIAQGQLKIGIELCEDLWMPVPPSSWQAAAGANLLLNLSASNELIGKAQWREILVRSQSGRCLAAYAYASAGPGESTTDLVFGGHCMIAENGALLAESVRVGNSGGLAVQQTSATADIDLQRLSHDRRITISWQMATQRLRREFRLIEVPSKSKPSDGALRTVSGQPFVPASRRARPLPEMVLGNKLTFYMEQSV